MAGVPAHKAAGQNCPALTWHINRSQQADKTVSLSGPIWYEGGVGVSFAQGTAQPDGSFTMNVQSISGNGPTGTLSGQRRRDGGADVTATGSPCFGGTYHLRAGQTTAKM